MVRIKQISALFLILLSACTSGSHKRMIMTVKGPLSAGKMDVSLVHEHILVDFSGSDTTIDKKWDRSDVVRKVLPFLNEIKERGCKTFFECTPVFLGRDPLLLKMLSDSTGLNIVTNTGYYVTPDFIKDQSADQYASKWIYEWQNGIDGTGIRPGFIKISVNNGRLTGQSQKLIIAAARAHLKTGLVISSHTGTAIPAFQQIEILLDEGVLPEAFIWVHAQAEKDYERHAEAARQGAWISFDGLNDNNVTGYAEAIMNMKKNKLLHKVLVSHDAGWYSPGEENGGKYRGYTTLFDKLIPLLREKKFSDNEIQQLISVNPAKAFEIKIRKLE